MPHGWSPHLPGGGLRDVVDVGQGRRSRRLHKPSTILDASSPAEIQKTGDSALSGLEKGPIDDNVYRDDYNNKLRNGAGQFREISLIRSSPAMTSESGECVVASADA
jgi:hypothetical protein